MSSPGSDSPADDLVPVLAALADERRRLVLAYFESSEEVASLDALAEYVTPRVRGTDDQRTVAVRLHHNTLPKLDDFGLLEYDPRSHTVRYRGHPTLERYLPVFAERETVAQRDYCGARDR